jgi:hypothetical protein
MARASGFGVNCCRQIRLQRLPAPNNSFNRSANSIAFMCKTQLVIMAHRARLIRALGGGLRWSRSSSVIAPRMAFILRGDSPII